MKTLGYDPTWAPLLSPAARSSLAAVGCPLNEPLVAALPLAVRAVNTCLRSGDRTIDDLISRTPEHMRMWRNFGPKSYIEIVRALRAFLAPWLAQLPPDLLDREVLGGADDAGQEAPTPATAISAPDQQDKAPTEKTPLSALRDSDLIAALDLFDVPWRDVFVDVSEPNYANTPPADATFATVGIANTSPPAAYASPLAQTERALQQVVALFPLLGASVTIGEWTLGELLEDSKAADLFSAIPSGQMFGLLYRLTARLAALLAARVTPPHQPTGNDEALATLHSVTIAALLDELFSGSAGVHLRPRDVEVVYARAGLISGKRDTLGDIAARSGLTRERIRQIELLAYKHMEQQSITLALRTLGAIVRCAVQACGGVATPDAAAVKLGKWIPFGGVYPAAATRFLARWCDDLIITNGDLLIVKPYTESLVRQMQDALKYVLRTHHTIARNDLLAEARLSDGEDTLATDVNFIAAVLETLPNITEKDEQYQPAGRNSIQSRVVLAMRRLGHPAKVSEVADTYRSLYPDESGRKDNSIRAMFDRFSDTFVLVGLSTYALAEWGYDPAIKSVAALVEHLLEESDQPLYYEEVVEQAAERYYWKAVSVRAQLGTNPRIQPFGSGFFGLRARDYGAFDSASAYGGMTGSELHGKERLVIGSYTNARGHFVVHVRLSEFRTSGYLPLTSIALRELFPRQGKFRAEVCASAAMDAQPTEITLSRGGHEVSGLRPLLVSAHAQAGDMLFIERLAVDAQSNAPAYRVAFAAATDVSCMDAARRAVGLSSQGEADDDDIHVLHAVRAARGWNRRADGSVGMAEGVRWTISLSNAYGVP